MSRRELLRLGVWSGASIALHGLVRATGEESEPLTRPIPRSGEPLPVIGLGTARTFDVPSSQEPARVREVLRRFAEQGGRLVDTSPMYGSAESVLGRLAAELRWTDRLFLATKVWTRGRDEGIRQMEESLRLLRRKSLELMQVHNLIDAGTHMATLRRWKAEGRIRYLGVTHYRVDAFDRLERLVREESLDFVQLNYSVLTPAAEQRLLPLAAEHDTAVIVNRPFENGGWFQRIRGRELPGWARELGCESWAQFALKYIVSHPAVTCVIPATSDPKHLDDNMRAGLGPLPDAPTRQRMRELAASL